VTKNWNIRFWSGPFKVIAGLLAAEFIPKSFVRGQCPKNKFFFLTWPRRWERNLVGCLQVIPTAGAGYGESQRNRKQEFWSSMNDFPPLLDVDWASRCLFLFPHCSSLRFFINSMALMQCVFFLRKWRKMIYAGDCRNQVGKNWLQRRYFRFYHLVVVTLPALLALISYFE